MPTLTVYPQADGYYQLWDSVEPVGSDGYETVDEATTDDDTGYLILDKFTTIAGAASFAFGSASNILPTQIVITCRAKIEAGVSGGAIAVDASTEVMAAGYATFTRTFATNPFTGAAWAVDEMKNLELYVSTVVPVLGKVRVTMLNATITYTLPTNFGIWPEPIVMRTA
jgi:hypothetical protein